jgi:DUF177 domain-containing protein
MSELLLDVGQMRDPEARIERTFAAGVLPTDQSICRITAPVALSVVVRKDRMQFRLAGRLKTSIELTCSRCLDNFELAVDEPFDVLYLPHTPAGPGEERMVEDDDLSTAFYEDNVIDLGQLMQEQCYLAVPMKPLCKEECQGLCPECGTNFNIASCECRQTWVDPRLAVLDQLRKDK